MRNLIIIFLLLATGSLFAVPVTYYISPTGNNGNIGTSPASAWQTIARLNTGMSVIQPGDTIKFERGGTYYGSIVPTKNTLYFTSYGASSAKPIISGFTDCTTWTNAGGNFWNCTPAILPKTRVNLLTKNGLPVEIGRYPNAGSWLKYESHSAGSSITDNELPASPSWTGADVAIRKGGYVLQSLNITSHSTHVLNVATIPTINPANGSAFSSEPEADGFGYVIYRHPSTLDVQDEWAYEPGGPKIVMYSTTSPTGIRVSTVDTLFNAGSRTGITIDGLAFEGGDMAAIYSLNGGTLTVKNCHIFNSGARGIYVFNSPNTIIQNTPVAWCLNAGITIEGRYIAGATVTGCTVTNIANFATQGNRFDPADMNMIYEDMARDVAITGNVLRNGGFNGIFFHADNVVVQYNFSDTTNCIKDDGGPIYTYPQRANTNSRVVDHNICLHSLGAPLGNAFPTHAEGLYNDGGARGIAWTNNTLAYGAGSGWYLNDPKNVTVSGNTGYSNGNNLNNNGSGQGGQKHCADSTFGFVMNNNIIWSTNNRQKSFYYYNYGFNGTGTPISATLNAAMAAWGTIDGNYYNVASGDSAFVLWGENPCGGSTYPKSNRSFSQFQSLQDAHSTAISVTGEHFYYNAAMADTTIVFTGRIMRDARGVNYNNFYVLHAFESAVLYDVGSITPPDQTPVTVPVYLPYKFIPN